MSGSNPPSTNGSPRIARRARTSSAAAFLAITLPVILVGATAGMPASGSVPEPAATGGTSSNGVPFLLDQVGFVQAVATSDAVAFDALTLGTTPMVLAGPTQATSTPVTTAPTTTVPAPVPVAPAPAPAPAPAANGGGDPNDPASWARLAACESGGNWAINSGNGYYGGLQFSLSSWQGVGGTGYPHEHSSDTQIEMGRRLYDQGGWGHWPACTRSFGWR